MSDATVWGLCMQSVEIQASFDFHPSLMLQRETAASDSAHLRNPASTNFIS